MTSVDRATGFSPPKTQRLGYAKRRYISRVHLREDLFYLVLIAQMRDDSSHTFARVALALKSDKYPIRDV